MCDFVGNFPHGIEHNSPQMHSNRNYALLVLFSKINLFRSDIGLISIHCTFVQPITDGSNCTTCYRRRKGLISLHSLDCRKKSTLLFSTRTFPLLKEPIPRETTCSIWLRNFLMSVNWMVKTTTGRCVLVCRMSGDYLLL